MKNLYNDMSSSPIESYSLSNFAYSTRQTISRIPIDFMNYGLSSCISECKAIPLSAVFDDNLTLDASFAADQLMGTTLQSSNQERNGSFSTTTTFTLSSNPRFVDTLATLQVKDQLTACFTKLSISIRHSRVYRLMRLKGFDRERPLRVQHR